MRRHELVALNKALKEHNDILKRERDEARNEARDAVNEGITKVHAAVRTVKGSLADLHEKADAHAAALAKHGDDLAAVLTGLAKAVQAPLLASEAEPEADKPAAAEPEKPAAPTPIASRRGSKAAG